GHAAFVGEARRVVGARILEALMAARAFLHIGAGRVDRRHDGAGRRVRRLPGMDRAGAEMVAGVGRGFLSAAVCAGCAGDGGPGWGNTLDRYRAGSPMIARPMGCPLPDTHAVSWSPGATSLAPRK